MQGQKQILTFIVILLIICFFTFFRNALRKDKQLKRFREEALRKKLETSLEYNEVETDANDVTDFVQSNKHETYLYKFLEYKDICFDLHAIIFKPEKEIELVLSSNLNLDSNSDMKNPVVKNIPTDHDSTSHLDSKHKKSVITEPVLYLFIIVLIYSFLKAATDISKQLSKKSDSDDSTIRKLSLQEYANNKHHKRSSKGRLLKRATTGAIEPRIKIKQQSLDERRRSYIIPEFNGGSGLKTEPGTPPKVLNGLGCRPPPLLRRCSVPAFAIPHAGHGSLIRRPSVDSFSEDDSSPDVKRRVRMIHRH